MFELASEGTFCRAPSSRLASRTRADLVKWLSEELSHPDAVFWAPPADELSKSQLSHSLLLFLNFCKLSHVRAWAFI